MKSVAILSTVFATAALAQPHNHGHGAQPARRHHQLHQAAHNKEARDVPPVTSWTTEWVTETVVEYIDEASTVWITPGHTTSTVLLTLTTSVHASATSSSSSSSSSSSQPAGQFFQGASSSSSSTTLSTSTTTLAPVAAQVQQTTTTTTTTPPPPPPTTTTTTTTTTPPPPPPSTTTTTTAAAATTTTASSGGSGSGATNTGDLTYYTIGLGACGEDDTGKDLSKPIVALSYLLMGPLSNTNPYCGRSITIEYGGKTTTATVQDKCMGCKIHDIDVSQVVFTDIFDLSVGRHSVNWYFND